MGKLLQRLWKLFLRAGWAPFLVLIVHRILLIKGWRENTDFLMHFSGGLSFAYLAFHALDEFDEVLGKLNRLGHYSVAFLATCTMALFWEFAEYALDGIRGSNIQHSIDETMWDLINGTLGGATTLSLIWIWSRLKGRESSQPQ